MFSELEQSSNNTVKTDFSKIINRTTDYRANI